MQRGGCCLGSRAWSGPVTSSPLFRISCFQSKTDPTNLLLKQYFYSKYFFNYSTLYDDFTIIHTCNSWHLPLHHFITNLISECVWPVQKFAFRNRIVARHQPEYTDLKINQNSTLSTPTESSILPNVTDQSALFRLLLRYMSRIYITHRNHYHQSNNTTNNNQQMYTYQAAAAALPTILCIPTRNQEKEKELTN